MTDRFLKVQEVAELLACHEHTVIRMIRCRAITALNLRGSWRIRQSALDQFIQIYTRPSVREDLPRPLRSRRKKSEPEA